MERHNKGIISLIIIILLLTEFFIIINLLQAGDYSGFLWICYITLPIIIVGLLLRNPNIILSQIIIIAIPDLFWTIDFLFLIFAGHTVFGIGAVTGFPRESIIGKLASLFHLYTVPLSLVALSQIKLKKDYRLLFISLLEITLIFLITLLFIPNVNGLNCVNISCINIPLKFLPYNLLWLLFTFSFVIISYFIITSLPFLIGKKEKYKIKNIKHKT